MFVFEIDLIDGVEHGKKVKACLEFLLKIDENFDTTSMTDNSVTDPVIVKRQQVTFLTMFLHNTYILFYFIYNVLTCSDFTHISKKNYPILKRIVKIIVITLKKDCNDIIFFKLDEL